MSHTGKNKDSKGAIYKKKKKKKKVSLNWQMLCKEGSKELGFVMLFH
jgi:hypothetical protein